MVVGQGHWPCLGSTTGLAAASDTAVTRRVASLVKYMLYRGNIELWSVED